MRTCRKMCNFKAILSSKALSFQCSASESGNIGSHKLQRGCRSNFHLFSGAFPIILPAVQLSRPRPFFLLGLGKKHFLMVNAFLFAKTITLFFLPAVLIPQSSLLLSKYFTLQWLLRLLFTQEGKKSVRFFSQVSSFRNPLLPCLYWFSGRWCTSGPATKGPPSV